MTTPVRIAAPACSAWQHQVNAAQLMAQDADLVTYLDGVPPGIDYFQWSSSTWKYVNNEDGSVSGEPDVPKGNTGIFLCTGLAPAPWSTKKKVLVFGGAGAAVALAAGGAWWLHKRRKGKR